MKNNSSRLKILLILSFLASSFFIIIKYTHANSHINIKDPKVQDFINQVSKKHKNLDKDYLTKVLQSANHNQEVIDRIKKPYEALEWSRYKNFFITQDRINEGLKFWKQHENTLNKAQEKYGVPPEIILAIIGVETNYGKNKGKFPVLDSLATLSFDYEPRSRFFKSELEQFILLAKEENWEPRSIKGSYAGAMGYPQFISSSFRNYAVDFTNDGHRDLLNNPEDAIGSVANYFYKHGWERNKPVTIPVKAKSTRFNSLKNIKDLKPKYRINVLENFGVDTTNNNKIINQLDRKKDTLVSLVELTHQQDKNNPKNPNSEYWLGLKNFYVITRYNLSNNYAMAVYQLSEKIKNAHDKQNFAKS